MSPLRDTTPVVNILQGYPAELQEALLKALASVGEAGSPRNFTKFAKARLGKQTRTFRNSYLYSLWEFPKATLWVSKRGFCIEVLPDLSHEEALSAAMEIFSKLQGESHV